MLDVESFGPTKRGLVAFPAYALLVVEERLREQEGEGIEMPASVERDELALRILVTAELARRSWDDG